MKQEIENIINWNKLADNNKFNYWLEVSMLSEEFAELIVALKEKDKIEAVDWLLDIFWVGIGSLHKLWLNAEQISDSFEEIMKSNYSKFVDWECIKNENWKIMKPRTYFKPNLKQFVK